MKRFKDILTIILFAGIMFGFGLAHILLPDGDVSLSERRKLTQMPELTAEAVFSGGFSGELEEYILDQFPLREQFRRLHSAIRIDLMRQNDVNGLWLSDGHIFKNEDPLDESQVLYGAGVIDRVCKDYLDGMNIFYSIIPDKGYFAPEENNREKFDYEHLAELMTQTVEHAEYIDIFDTLSLDDYYKTDTHWSQDKIFSTVYKLAEAMGVSDDITPPEEYTVSELYPFYGVYYGQAALSAEPDTLYYLTSVYTENAKVSGIESTVSEDVYAVDKFNGLDGYDVFLSGAQPIVEIECPNAASERELIIFRDSFGSSIAPLFTGAYSKITLIDLRYIASPLLEDYVEFAGQDVLFLYSAQLLNSSMLLK